MTTAARHVLAGFTGNDQAAGIAAEVARPDVDNDAGLTLATSLSGCEAEPSRA